MRISRGALPNTITVSGIFLGYLSIMLSLRGDYLIAALLLILVGILDSLDGKVARAINATSEFGVELDSLADVINFGVAPSLLFYKLYFIDWGVPGMLISFLPVVCSALRLARFNVNTEVDNKSKYYTGLPTTLSAAFLASYVFFAHDTWGHFGLPQAAGGLIAITSILMISQIQYTGDWAFPRRGRGIILVLVITSLIISPARAFFVWLTLFIGFGLARSAFITGVDYARRQGNKRTSS